MDGWTGAVGRGDHDLAWARHRSAALSAARIPGVCVPHRVVMDARGAVLATMPRIDGLDAAAFVASGRRLTEAQVRSVGRTLADALAGLHRAGLVHGDVSTSNVMLSPDGAVLVDALTPPTCPGTPGFIDPDRPEHPEPADDVYGLGAVLSALVRPDDREAVDAWVAPLLGAREQRPTAAQVAQAWTQWGPVAPWEWVGPLLASTGADRTLGDEPDATTPQNATPGTSAVPRTLSVPQGQAWRIYRGSWRIVRALVALGTATVVVGTASALLAVEPEPVVRPYSPVIPIPASADRGADVAAVDLTERRVAAMASGDADALTALAAPDSMALSAMAPVVEMMDDGYRWEGAAVIQADATVLSQRGDRASVMVEYTIGAHAVVRGSERTEVGVSTARVQVDLRWSVAGWQVERAMPASSPS